VQSAGFHVDVGEWAVLFTDGLTEMTNPAGDMLGLKPLREHLGRTVLPGRRLHGRGIGAAPDRLARRLPRAAPPASDDRTFLIGPPCRLKPVRPAAQPMW
jgi:hypothetical protein